MELSVNAHHSCVQDVPSRSFKVSREGADESTVSNMQGRAAMTGKGWKVLAVVGKAGG